MLMKLTPWVDLPTFFCAAFTCADPKSEKKDWQLNYIFCAFGLCGYKSFSQKVGEINPTYWLKEQMHQGKEFGTISFHNDTVPNFTSKHN